ncbi:MAG TPA: hypothetical protein VFU94_06055 [Conexibacter sp.]|nr:hypothetical protein [Conexibacter sp.]
MKQQLSREEYEERLATLRAERDMFKRLARRNLELAIRLSDLHVRQAVRELRRGK